MSFCATKVALTLLILKFGPLHCFYNKSCLDFLSSMFVTIFFVTRLLCNSPAADIYTKATCFKPMYEKEQQLNAIVWKCGQRPTEILSNYFYSHNLMPLKGSLFLPGCIVFILNHKPFSLVKLTSVIQLPWCVCPNHLILWKQPCLFRD